MDTRKKIVQPDAIVRDGRPWTVILGYFDPVYAVHIARLQEAARPGSVIIAAIADPERPLLPWRARAEIVAGLACIDYVLSASDAASLTPETTIDLREAHQQATAALSAHVVARHKSA